MITVIKIVGNAHGGPTGYGGTYVKGMDFEAFEGRGHLVVTHDRGKALEFPSIMAAMAYWQTTSKTVPLRPDGKPNRPLTAYTVEIIR